MIGQRFGSFVVIGREPNGHPLCRCDCGRESIVPSASLRRGKSTQCGRCRCGSPKIIADVEAIIARVAADYGETVAAIKSGRRNQPLVSIRHFAMWLAREETGASLPVIARCFGNRDHTTVLHAITTMQERIRAGQAWADAAKRLGQRRAA